MIFQKKTRNEDNKQAVLPLSWLTAAHFCDQNDINSHTQKHFPRARTWNKEQGGDMLQLRDTPKSPPWCLPSSPLATT